MGQVVKCLYQELVNSIVVNKCSYDFVAIDVLPYI